VSQVNLNNFAREITLQEGMKKSLSIAQVKEVLRLILSEFSKMDEAEVIKVINRYKNK
jgi:hypothetical protein